MINMVAVAIAGGLVAVCMGNAFAPYDFLRRKRARNGAWGDIAGTIRWFCRIRLLLHRNNTLAKRGLRTRVERPDHRRGGRAREALRGALA